MRVKQIIDSAAAVLTTPAPRTGSASPRLDEAEFRKRFRSQFADPAYAPLQTELDRISDAAWDAYLHERKSPRTRRAGPGYADPEYELALDWITAKGAIEAAQARHDDGDGPLRVLLINGSSRSEHTCPGELSKSWRLCQLAREILEGEGATVAFLDLSHIASEYGRHIHPCKACFSTAAALCHWPCSCYPNYSLGQTHDMMNDIYPLWVEAHGVMIVTPVNWYSPSSPVKLMMDRLVCADGGNPDPSLTHGKNARAAKREELKGWPYPRHLKGRLFSVIVHGDVEGAENVRRSLCDWMRFMHMESAGAEAELDRYIGYWKPYATSHDELDRDEALQDEVRNAARTLGEALRNQRAGRLRQAGQSLKEPRPK
ncbi:MAG: NADPH-dependent reductase [Sphingomonas bacterium]|uniref:flavodoxin family protein n=1 Tax=Sphingomonas bacterium TaxID=1895847 RepID=UPI00262A09E8|nr:flavodoxin family protein [Sphingomonas bacterium]MDB5708648.1 NADPH-dependent reductase [Sphingomonas bacterium]